MNNRTDPQQDKLIKWGIWAAVVASACCWLPLLLLSLGAINISTVLAIGYRTPYFITAGLTLVGLSLFFFWRGRYRNRCCITQQTVKKDILLTIGIIAFVLLLTYLIKYVLLPNLAPIIYDNL
jgi:magnesium-transporting ATPase (P-type)